MCCAEESGITTLLIELFDVRCLASSRSLFVFAASLLLLVLRFGCPQQMTTL